MSLLVRLKKSGQIWSLHPVEEKKPLHSSNILLQKGKTHKNEKASWKEIEKSSQQGKMIKDATTEAQSKIVPAIKEQTLKRTIS